MRYKKIKDVSGQDSAVMIIKIDGAVSSIVPFDAKNKDYKAYQAWLAQNNTPESAD